MEANFIRKTKPGAKMNDLWEKSCQKHSGRFSVFAILCKDELVKMKCQMLRMGLNGNARAIRKIAELLLFWLAPVMFAMDFRTEPAIVVNVGRPHMAAFRELFVPCDVETSGPARLNREGVHLTLKRQLNMTEICKSLSQKAVRRKRAYPTRICELSTNSFMARILRRSVMGNCRFKV